MTTEPELRRTFETAARTYQSARPDYPEELFDDLVALTGIAPPTDLLEIGCGPGKATLPLARRGFTITALELGELLAEQARRNLSDYPGVSIITGSFDDPRPDHDRQRFAVVYAANAWHWLDPVTRWARAASLLEPGGHLAVWGASHALPDGFDPLFTEIQAVYRKLGEAGDAPWPPSQSQPDPTAEYEASGHFEVVAVRRYQWALSYTADSYIALLDTFSNHIAMGAAERARLYGEVRRLLAERADGRLLRHWRSTLVIARKRDPDPRRA